MNKQTAASIKRAGAIVLNLDKSANRSIYPEESFSTWGFYVTEMTDSWQETCQGVTKRSNFLSNVLFLKVCTFTRVPDDQQ